MYFINDFTCFFLKNLKSVDIHHLKKFENIAIKQNQGCFFQNFFFIEVLLSEDEAH